MIKKVLPEDEQLVNRRLDVALAALLPDLSRAHIQRLIEEGLVTVNKRVAPKSRKLSAGDVIETAQTPPEDTAVVPMNIPLDIPYEDDDLLVVNKPRGMVVHPAAGNRDGTLVNALLYHCSGSLSGINGFLRPGIVHRIDKDTSGLLLVAKNDFAHHSLANQLSRHSIKREYRAVVYGTFAEPTGTVDAPIGRNPRDRKSFCVTSTNSKKAVTHFEVLAAGEKYSMLRLTLETGRTHQIRVHMAYIGHPVAGDRVYAHKAARALLEGQCLHAALIGFIHPRKGSYIEISSPLPSYFIDAARRAGIAAEAR